MLNTLDTIYYICSHQDQYTTIVIDENGDDYTPIQAIEYLAGGKAETLYLLNGTLIPNTLIIYNK